MVASSRPNHQDRGCSRVQSPGTRPAVRHFNVRVMAMVIPEPFVALLMPGCPSWAR